MANKKATALQSFGLFAVAIALFLGLRWSLFEPFLIPSGSMIPTLLVNDHILVSKYDYGLRLPFTSFWITNPSLPKRGDIVVFRSVDQDDYYLIKRVIGLPGDKIDFNAEGELRINDEAVASKEIAMPKSYTSAEIETEPEKYQMFDERIGEHNHALLLEKNAFHYAVNNHIVPAGKIFMMGDNRDRSRDSRFWGDLPIENLIGRARWVWLSCSGTVSNLNFLCDPRQIRWQQTFRRIE